MQSLPKIGEPAMVAGIHFPLTVQSFCQDTRSAFLKGEHPETGMEVLLPRVCLKLLHVPTQETKFAYAVGQYARLKSYGPLMTVVEVRPPLPDAPDGAGTELVCWYFSDNELCEFEGDARALNVSDKRCDV
jgi:hypothetical protein